MATREAIRDRVGNDLGILPFNQSLPPEHATRVDSAYEEVFADLKQRGLALWAYEDGDVPAEYVPHVVALTAMNCIKSGSYAVPIDRYDRIRLAAKEALPEIRSIIGGRFLTRDCPRDY